VLTKAALNDRQQPQQAGLLWQALLLHCCCLYVGQYGSDGCWLCCCWACCC
jgi:hypothetical protein